MTTLEYNNLLSELNIINYSISRKYGPRSIVVSLRTVTKAQLVRSVEEKLDRVKERNFILEKELLTPMAAVCKGC